MAGALFSLDRKKWLPLPPAPPRAAMNLEFGSSKEASIWPDSDLITVPRGTLGKEIWHNELWKKYHEIYPHVSENT